MALADQKTISFAVRGPIAREDLPGLCDRVCALLDAARANVGCQVRLRHASQELLDSWPSWACARCCRTED